MCGKKGQTPQGKKFPENIYYLLQIQKHLLKTTSLVFLMRLYIYTS